MGDFKIGEYIIYVNGDKYELGRIKSDMNTHNGFYQNE